MLVLGITLFVLGLVPFLFVRCRLLLWLLSHDALELRPQRLDRGELVAHGDDGLERAVELVDVGQDVFEALL